MLVIKSQDVEYVTKFYFLVYITEKPKLNDMKFNCTDLIERTDEVKVTNDKEDV